MPDDVHNDGPIPPDGDAVDAVYASDGSGDTGDIGTPEQQLALFLKNLFTTEILPSFQQHQDQVLDVRLTEIRSWVSQQITPLTPQALAQQVGEIIAPRFNSELKQGIDSILMLVRPVADRLAVLEARPAPAQATVSQQAAVAEVPPEGAEPGGVAKIAAVAETVIDIAVQKLLPALAQFQQMRQSNKLFSMDPTAIETFRKANPAYAMVLAQQLAPDATVAGVMAQLPFTLATGIATGMRARALAPQLISGGGSWPGTPGSGSPGLSPNIPGGPSPGPTGPRAGASMQNRRPRPSKQGKTGFLSSRITFINGAKPQAPKKLSELLN